MHHPKPKYSIGADLVSYVEIKPNFDLNISSHIVKVKINWLFQATGVYVNLVKVPQIFKDTFVPDRYFLTDEAKKTRQIKYETKRNRQTNKNIRYQYSTFSFVIE